MDDMPVDMLGRLEMWINDLPIGTTIERKEHVWYVQWDNGAKYAYGGTFVQALEKAWMTITGRREF